MRYLTYALLFVAAVSLSSASSILPKAEKDVVPVEDFPDYTWVCYAPTHYNPNEDLYPLEPDITADLEVLNDYVFTGVTTYGSEDSLGDIPLIADEVGGFDVFIMGIFYYNDVTVQEEIENAIAAAEYVDAYCVGNEGLSDRYTIEQLEDVMDQIIAATGKPVTTAEQVEDYLAGDEIADWLLAPSSDYNAWLFPIIHPVNNDIHDPAAGVAWTEDRYNQMLGLADGKLVFVRETGWPTDGEDWATEENQADYFTFLAATDVFFSYFEAFDQYWKTWLPWEPYYGLFDMYRNPKLFVSEMSGGVDIVDFAADAEDEGVLVSWSITGDVPTGLHVLRSMGDAEPVAIHDNPLPGTATHYLDRKDEGFQPLAGVEYRYWLEVIDSDGLVRRFGPTEPVSLPEQISRLALGEPYPSPARDAVTIRYALPNGCSGAVIEVYDLSGRRIDTFPLAPQPARGELYLDVSDYASGVYTARLSTDEGSVSRRLVITR